jgi:hypothetical protein
MPGFLSSDFSSSRTAELTEVYRICMFVLINSSFRIRLFKDCYSSAFITHENLARYYWKMPPNSCGYSSVSSGQLLFWKDSHTKLTIAIDNRKDSWPLAANIFAACFTWHKDFPRFSMFFGDNQGHDCWRWWQETCLKRRSVSTRLHATASYKTAIFLTTTMLRMLLVCISKWHTHVWEFSAEGGCCVW